MANAIPVRVPGTGGSTLQYVLPANMMQFVQSVNAVIDNSAGADAKPVLTVLDSTAEVIADVPQGRSIPAGDSGRATWALRLADEGASGGTPFVVGSAEFFEHQQNVLSGVPTAIAWARVFGPVLLDLTVPTAPTFITGGVYSVTVTTLIFVPVAGKSGFVSLGIGIAAAGTQTFPLGPIGSPSIPAGSVSVTNRYAAGDALGVNVMHDAGVTKTVDLFAYVTKLAA